MGYGWTVLLFGDKGKDGGSYRSWVKEKRKNKQGKKDKDRCEKKESWGDMALHLKLSDEPREKFGRKIERVSRGWLEREKERDGEKCNVDGLVPAVLAIGLMWLAGVGKCLNEMDTK